MKRPKGLSVRSNMVTELRKLARGKPTKLPAEILLRWAADRMRTFEIAYEMEEKVQRRPDIAELERLYRLEDPRG